MLGKLMKYDIKKMSRILVYIYAVALGLATITRLVNIGKDIQILYIIGKVFEGVTFSALASVLINAFIHILAVFITNLYKDESYLTHTLPIKKSKLLLSKYLSSLIVVIASVSVCLLCVFIMFYSKTNMQFLEAFIKATVANFNISAGLFITLMVLIVFSQICALMSFSFTAVIKANQYNHKRIIKGLAWFLLFYFGSSIVTLLSCAFVFAITGRITELFAVQLSQTTFLMVLITGLIMYIIYSIAFYFISQKLFKKGVNID